MVSSFHSLVSSNHPVFLRASGRREIEGKTVGDTMDVIRDVPVEVYYDNENLVVTGVPETVI